jgi:hypothetical protein
MTPAVRAAATVPSNIFRKTTQLKRLAEANFNIGAFLAVAHI